jgi:H2-forming N5,N10-methylenetetrahydromethanopterin dehydrogenase-like enzyme
VGTSECPVLLLQTQCTLPSFILSLTKHLYREAEYCERVQVTISSLLPNDRNGTEIHRKYVIQRAVTPDNYSSDK